MAPLVVRLVAFLALCALASAAQAQFPSRPILVLIPQPPGGANDTVARVIAPQLGERLGQPIIVENRPGANGNLAMEVVAKAAPDGYTLLLGADAQIVINPHFYPNLPFDTLKDLVPVASVVNTQMVLAVNPALPVKNLQEFIDYARNARPPLAYGSIGNGSQHHLVMEMLKQRAQIDLLHVPFKGGGPATMALIAGEISAAFGGNSVTGPARAGKLRALAVGNDKRVASIPDVPTFAETGHPLVNDPSWFGLIGPARLPAEVISRVHAALVATLRQPEAAKRLLDNASVPVGNSPEAFRKVVSDALDNTRKVVREANLKFE